MRKLVYLPRRLWFLCPVSQDLRGRFEWPLEEERMRCVAQWECSVSAISQRKHEPPLLV